MIVNVFICTRLFFREYAMHLRLQYFHFIVFISRVVKEKRAVNTSKILKIKL